ncbi:winged helix-turn-helix domain-containing protein [Entomohabitans teleogrylli]|uniref:winged helix-turn-helix domain-containing protein n=1 Tax=Entomohabitans teleogrylli TaxID=1384589 RepID=UPI00073D61D4|nr:winged helix-turn-helix domain-containing protein [Entomohabitans teleogrylli]
MSVIYIIDNTIYFSVSESCLYVEEPGRDPIYLSRSASRLLMELVKNSGKDLSREYLLDKVWEDYGYRSSDGNLNNTISQLRKSFVALGLSKKIVVTLPKIGFRFEAPVSRLEDENIEPDGRSEKTAAAPDIDNECRAAAPAECAAPPNVSGEPGRRRLMYLTLMMVFIGLVGYLGYSTARQTRLHTAPQPLFKIEQCNIIPMVPVDDERIAHVVDQVKKFIVRQEIACARKEYDIFFRMSDSQFESRYMFSVCRQKSAAGYVNCHNVNTMVATSSRRKPLS